MKKIASLAFASLLSSAAHAASPQLADIGTEPDCAAGAFFGTYYEGKTAGKNLMHQHFHPAELELWLGVGLDTLDSKLKAELKDPKTAAGKAFAAAAAETKAAKPKAAPFSALAKIVRPRLKKAVEAKLALSAVAPTKPKLSAFEAREVACRLGHAGERAGLDKAMTASDAKPETAQTSAVYWSAFSRTELKAYLSEAPSDEGKPVADYKKLWEGMSARAKAAVAGAADPAKQDALIKAAGLTYAIPNVALKKEETVVPKEEPKAAPVLALTPAEKQQLPDKLLADYIADREQILEANKGKKPEEIATAMKPILERYREIGALRGRMPDEHRKQYDAKINATSSRQQRDGITEQYAKAFTPKKQLDLAANDPNAAFDGKKKEKPLVVAGGGDGRSKAEQEEDLARAQREVTEAGKAKKIGGDVPNLLASGVVPDKGPEEKKKDPNDSRDLINGAKLGLWGAMVGFLTMGPLGMLFMGLIMMGLGTVMSKEMNK